MIFNIVDVKNSNVKIFMKYYIDDMTTILNSFTNFFFKFESFLKEKSATQTHEKKQKKKIENKNENESFEKTKKKKINKCISFLCLTFI